MRLLQWNVWYREDVQNILRTIRDIDPDVVCLQELTVNHTEYNKGVNVPELLASELAYEHVYAPAMQKGAQQSGNGIFSRYPIRSFRSHFIQEPPSAGQEAVGYSNEGRVYVEAMLQIDEGEMIEVGTVHMSYTDRFAMTPAKTAETNKLLDILKSKRERYLFTGDLNATPDSYTISEIAKVLKHCGPDMDECTWTTKLFSYNGFEAHTLDWRLDYCFATPDIEITDARVMTTDHSDHLPILIELNG